MLASNLAHRPALIRENGIRAAREILGLLYRKLIDALGIRRLLVQMIGYPRSLTGKV